MSATFRGTARSERHFSALLLPHLLMSNNFAGCRALFRKLEICDGEPFDPNKVEIVAELNPVRDVAERSDEMEMEALGRQSHVVPDLFLRIGDSALVIEAKFFTHPPASAVRDQLAKQRNAIESVRRYTEYADCTFSYLALTVDELKPNFADRDAGIFHMTWCEVIEALKQVFNTDDGQDMSYALNDLENAVKRSKKERTSSNERGRCKTIEDLLGQSLTLLKDGNRYIGFTGGKRALACATVKRMENRGHYKYSNCKPNKHWIPLHLVVSRYLKLKAQSEFDRHRHE